MTRAPIGYSLFVSMVHFFPHFAEPSFVVSIKKVNLAEKIKCLRSEYNLTQKQFAERLHVSEAYISQLEKGKVPSLMFLDLLLCKFRLNPEEFCQDIELKQALEEKSKKYFGPAVALLSLSAPAIPLVAGAGVAGIGAATLILRMLDAYGARTEKELAEKHLKIGKNTISTWKTRDKIPEKYLLKTSEDTGRPMGWILGRKELSVRPIVEKTVARAEKIVLAEGLTLAPGKKGEMIGFLVEEFIQTGEVSVQRIKDVVQLVAR